MIDICNYCNHDLDIIDIKVCGKCMSRSGGVPSGFKLKESAKELMKMLGVSTWIPCSVQEPPKDGKSVLVTMEDYKGDRFVTDTLDKRATKENKVVAWMPMPEVYGGE